MARAFTIEQRDAIRARLLNSACRHAITDGPQRTSLDTLTSEAGISKSSFYKFYATKEQLFLEVAGRWEAEIIKSATDALREHEGQSDKERAAAFVYTAFERIHRLGIVRFLREDLPYLNSFISRDTARTHYLNSARSLFEALRQAKIHFTEPDDIVLSVIQLMYLSILNIRDIGDTFFPALHTLVDSACEKLVM